MKRADNFNKIKEALAFYYYVKPFGNNRLEGNANNIISIFASARGGSTWLAETLGTIPNSALVWEPLFRYNQYKINTLNPFAYPERYNVDIGWNQHIPEDTDWEEAEEFFRKLFSAEIVNLKLYRYNQLSELPRADTYIYKFCFGNRLLPWLVKRFDIQPVFLIRHPCAVVASQLNYGAWDWHKSNFKYKKFSKFQMPFKEILNSINCVEERLAAEWAMNILTSIKSEHNDKKWVTLSYEDIYLRPEAALKKIFNRYKIKMPANILENIEEQSFTKSSFENKNTSDKLSQWKKTLSNNQIDTILCFIEKMGVDFYTDALEPNYSKIYV